MKIELDISTLPDEAQKALAQFPEFRIKKFINSGANGFVMLGQHSVLKKEVAIKIYFHKEDSIDQEPTLIASIDHENVLKVYDARKVKSDCSYFMTQSANYGDLKSYLDKFYLSLPYSKSIALPITFRFICSSCEEFGT